MDPARGMFGISCISYIPVVWGALPDIADTQVDDLLQTDQSVNEEYSVNSVDYALISY